MDRMDEEMKKINVDEMEDNDNGVLLDEIE
jgi:hypothetical protein